MSLKNYLKRISQYVFNDRVYYNTGYNKKVMLTFDDSFGDDVVNIVSCLSEFEISAIFFLTGEYIQDNLTDVVFLYEKGHIIANHTYFHEDLSRLSLLKSYRSIVRTEDLIKESLGCSYKLVRPPYGRISFTNFILLLVNGYKIYFWSAGGDEYKNMTSLDVFKSFKKNLSSSLNDIVLLHPNLKHSFGALPCLLSYLKASGVEFVHCSEFMKIR